MGLTIKVNVIAIGVYALLLYSHAYSIGFIDECNDTLDSLPAWSCQEVVDEAIGCLRWEGWAQMSYADRESANGGRPLRMMKLSSSHDTGKLRYGDYYPVRHSWNESVKLLAWSERRSMVHSIDGAVITYYDALLCCSYTDSVGKKRWAVMMLGRVDSPGTFGDSWDLAVPDLSLVMTPSISQRLRSRHKACSGDSVVWKPIRIFQHPPTTGDVDVFIDDRCCQSLKEIRNGFCGRNFFDIDPVSGRSLDGAFQFVRGQVRRQTWLNCIGETPDKSFPNVY